MHVFRSESQQKERCQIRHCLEGIWKLKTLGKGLKDAKEITEIGSMNVIIRLKNKWQAKQPVRNGTLLPDRKIRGSRIQRNRSITEENRLHRSLNQCKKSEAMNYITSIHCYIKIKGKHVNMIKKNEFKQPHVVTKSAGSSLNMYLPLENCIMLKSTKETEGIGYRK